MMTRMHTCSASLAKAAHTGLNNYLAQSMIHYNGAPEEQFDAYGRQDECISHFCRQKSLIETRSEDEWFRRDAQRSALNALNQIGANRKDS